MDIILYGDIFLHNIINYLDLKGLSKLKCVCKRYGQIISKTLVKQLTINNIKSELMKVFGTEYDKIKKNMDFFWKHEKCYTKYYVVKIGDVMYASGSRHFKNTLFYINEVSYIANYSCRYYESSKNYAMIHTIPSTLNISDLKNQIYKATDRTYFFLENDTEEPFELADHL
jgi:hypothetical protein